jgi:hypothetical protein
MYKLGEIDKCKYFAVELAIEFVRGKKENVTPLRELETLKKKIS